MPALQALPQTEVVALADIAPDNLRRAGDAFQVSLRYSGFRELVNDQAVDAVGVCPPVQFHAEIALAILDAGKHVILEKRATSASDEADQHFVSHVPEDE